MRPRRSFRVVLHREERQIAVAHAFERIVVEIHVGQFDLALRERVGIDGEVMVVGGDFDLAADQLLYWMIPAVVTEFQLEGFSS